MTLSDAVLTEKTSASPLLGGLPRLLQRGHALWGILRSIEPIGGGLLQVRVGDIDRLLPEELAPQLQPLIGKCVSIVRDGDRYGIGELRA